MAASSSDDDQTRSFTALAAGTVVSHYTIVSKIGAGGMGEVYLADDSSLGRKVALKFLSHHLCDDEAARSRFTREAKAAAKLDHPNIVPVHEVSEFEGRPFFAMANIEGSSLRDVIKLGKLSIPEIIELTKQICEGLHEAHTAGVIHRDIKPGNIIIDSKGKPRILDFGLATVAGEEKLTRPGSTLGTMGYMSPEQIEGKQVDQRSDLFSVGVILYEMLTGRRPFQGDTDAAVSRSITDTTPDPIARYKSGTTGELQQIVDKALSKDPSLRYQHADGMLADLNRLSSAALVQQTPLRGLKNYYVVISMVILFLMVVGYFGVPKFLTKNLRDPESARKMLAVLPFENLSPDPDQEYFSDGLTEELTSRLSLIQSLCVISRSSSMTFKGSKKTIPEIAQALKVQYVIEGSVRKAGNELRITAQLIDATADAHLWSKSYTGTMADVFDMQDSISQAIVDGIEAQLTPDEKQKLSERRFVDAEVYKYYLKGREELFKGTDSTIALGVLYLRRALENDKENALILSGLAWAQIFLVNTGIAQDEGIAEAKAMAEKALRIDPELPEAYVALGWINSWFLGDQRKAVKLFKKAIALDSTDRTASANLSMLYLDYCGKEAEARRYVELREVSDPLHSALDGLGWEAHARFATGDFCAALEPYSALHQVQKLGDHIDAFFYSMSLARCGKLSEALAVADESLQENPSSSIANLNQLLRYVTSKNADEALKSVTQAVKQTCRRDAVWSYHLGALLVACGAKDDAWEWLENAFDRGYINYPFLEKDPFLDSIRDDERFKELMVRVKYEWEHFDV